MDEDATWYGSRPRLVHIVLDRDTAHQRKGHSRLPLFGRCLLWPRLPISATAALLFHRSWVESSEANGCGHLQTMAGPISVCKIST